MTGKSSDRLCSNHSLLIFIALATLRAFYSPRFYDDLSRNFRSVRLSLVGIIDGGLKFRRHREHFYEHWHARWKRVFDREAARLLLRAGSHCGGM